MLLLLGAGPAVVNAGGGGITPPVASFTGTPLSGTAPLPVTFTDSSTGTGPLTYSWLKSSDGVTYVPFAGTPTAQNPTETFAIGTWSIKQVVTGPGGIPNTLTRTNYISSLFTPALLPSLTRWFPFGPSWDFTDAGGTTPCGPGDLIRVAKPAAGSSSINATQGTSGQRPTLDGGAGTWAGLFDGVNDQLGIAATGQPAPPWTIAAWTNYAALNGAAVSMTWTGAQTYLLAGAGAYQFQITGVGGAMASGGTPAAGVWTHLVGTFDGSTMNLYVNGVLVGTNTSTATLLLPTGANIGNAAASANWNGSLDQIVFCAAALSQSDVTNLFNYGHGAG